MDKVHSILGTLATTSDSGEKSFSFWPFPMSTIKSGERLFGLARKVARRLQAIEPMLLEARIKPETSPFLFG